MKFDEFVGRVQTLAGLGTTEATLKVTRAVLETLSQRLIKGEAEDLAAQLPSEIRNYIRPSESIQRFDLKGFFKRVGEKEGFSVELAEKHVRAVISVVTVAVSPGEIRDILSGLPEEFHELFSPALAESTMSPKR